MAAKTQEIWETTTEGTTFVNVQDPRNPEGWVQKKIGGKGTKRITLTTAEREFNSELVAYENEHLDPFKNGLLVRTSPKEVVRGPNEKSDDDLKAILAIDSDTLFTTAVDHIESEVIMRRLLDLCTRHAALYRHDIIREIVETRYAVGKTSRVVAEMMHDDAKYAGADR